MGFPPNGNTTGVLCYTHTGRLSRGTWRISLLGISSHRLKRMTTVAARPVAGVFWKRRGGAEGFFIRFWRLS
ncbi:unnamed protein product [Calypogeia fissa]